MKKKIIIDLDNTITIENQEKSYRDKEPNLKVINKLRDYKEMGFEIIIHTARNMKTYNGDLSKINTNTLPVIIKWLKVNEVPFDGIVVGKPWCGVNGFYVDDKSIRPDEFTNLDYNEILNIIK